MYCSKCGNELKEGMIFCNKCGQEIIKSKENIDTEKQEVFDGKLNELDKLIKEFFKEPSLKKYNFILKKTDNIIYGFKQNKENDKSDIVYLKAMDFFIKANLDERTNYFNITEYETAYNNVLKAVLENVSNKDVYEKVENKYEKKKEEYIEKYKEKRLAKISKFNWKNLFIIGIVIIIIIFILFIIAMIGENSNSKNISEYTNSSITTSSKVNNLSNEQIKEIKELWSSISGYGTKDIVEVIYNPKEKEDKYALTQLWVEYSSPTTNGMYVCNQNFGQISVHYGNDKYGMSNYSYFYNTFKTTMRNEEKEGKCTILTQNEFLQVLSK